MTCAGTRDYACWNAAAFDGHEAGRRLAAAVPAAAEALPEFDADFVARVEATASAGKAGRPGGLGRLDKSLVAVRRQVDNLLDAVADGGIGTALR